VLVSILILHKHIVKLPTPQTTLSPRIALESKYATFFTDCIGALDGTHIDVSLPWTSSQDIEIARGISLKTCLQPAILR
jgi:hypothetical protein